MLPCNFVPCSVYYKSVSPKLPLLDCWGFSICGVVCVVLEHGQAVQLLMNTIKYSAAWSYVHICVRLGTSVPRQKKACLALYDMWWAVVIDIHSHKGTMVCLLATATLNYFFQQSVAFCLLVNRWSSCGSFLHLSFLFVENLYRYTLFTRNWICTCVNSWWRVCLTRTIIIAICDYKATWPLHAYLGCNKISQELWRDL